MTFSNASDQVRIAWIIVAAREYIRKFYPMTTLSGIWEAKIHGATLFRTSESLSDTKIVFYNLASLSKYSFNLIKLYNDGDVIAIPLYYGALCFSGRTNFSSPKKFVFPIVDKKLAQANAPFDSTYVSFSQPVLFGKFLFVGCSNPLTPTTVDVVGTFFDPSDPSVELKIVIPHALAPNTIKNLSNASDPNIFQVDYPKPIDLEEKILVSDDDIEGVYEIQLDKPFPNDSKVLVSNGGSNTSKRDASDLPIDDSVSTDNLNDDQVTISTLDKYQVQTSKSDIFHPTSSGQSHSYHPFIEDIPCVYRINNEVIRPGLMQGMITTNKVAKSDNIMRSMLLSNYMIFTLISKLGAQAAVAKIAPFSFDGVIDLTSEYIKFCLVEIEANPTFYGLTADDIDWMSKFGCVVFATVTAIALENKLHWTAKWLLFVSMSKDILNRVNYRGDNDRDISFYPTKQRDYSAQAEMYVYDLHLINELAVARVDIYYEHSSKFPTNRNFAVARLPNNSGSKDTLHFVVVNSRKVIVYDSWYLRGPGSARAERKYTNPLPHANGSFLFFPRLRYSKGVNLMLFGLDLMGARGVIDVISKYRYNFDADLKKALITVNGSASHFVAILSSQVYQTFLGEPNPFWHWVVEIPLTYDNLIKAIKYEFGYHENYDDLLALVEGKVSSSNTIDAFNLKSGQVVAERQRGLSNSPTSRLNSPWFSSSGAQTVDRNTSDPSSSAEGAFSIYTTPSNGYSGMDIPTPPSSSLQFDDFPNSSW